MCCFVETHDFVRKPEDSPNPGHGHHEFGNAETYFLVGNALGEGMKKLLTPPQRGEKPEPPKPASHTIRNVEGWTVRVDDRLLAPPNDALGTRALRFLEYKLSDIKAVVAAEPLARLQAVTIVLDLSHGKLRSMQYHPGAGLAAGQRLRDQPREVRPHPRGRRPAHAAQHHRAALGRPARAGPRLSRPGAGLRGAADSQGLRGLQAQRPGRSRAPL